MDIIHKFYISKPWIELSTTLKVKANFKCERCGRKVKDKRLLIGHHKIELNESNVNDPHISLNPVNIEIICHSCHNVEHRRFGYKKKVYIVWGPPLSGKTSLVNQLMRYGDIILDIDAIWQAMTFQPDHVKPDNCRFNIFGVRDKILDQIKTRFGQWYDAYIIMSLPDKYEREKLANAMGAELIYCQATKEECFDRLYDSERPEVWKEYIDDWFDKFNGE